MRLFHVHLPALLHWIGGLMVLSSIFGFLLCMCNPWLALQIVISIFSFLFHLLPFSQCFVSTISSLYSVSTKLYTLSTVLPLSNILQILDRNLDRFTFIASHIESVLSFLTQAEVGLSPGETSLFSRQRLP